VNTSPVSPSHCPPEELYSEMADYFETSPSDSSIQTPGNLGSDEVTSLKHEVVNNNSAVNSFPSFTQAGERGEGCLRGATVEEKPEEGGFCARGSGERRGHMLARSRQGRGI